MFYATQRSYIWLSLFPFVFLSAVLIDWWIFFSLSSRSGISSALSSLLFIAFSSAFVLTSEFSHLDPLCSF